MKCLITKEERNGKEVRPSERDESKSSFQMLRGSLLTDFFVFIFLPFFKGHSWLRRHCSLREERKDLLFFICICPPISSQEAVCGAEREHVSSGKMELLKSPGHCLHRL